MPRRRTPTADRAGGKFQSVTQRKERARRVQEELNKDAETTALIAALKDDPETAALMDKVLEGMAVPQDLIDPWRRANATPAVPIDEAELTRYRRYAPARLAALDVAAQAMPLFLASLTTAMARGEGWAVKLYADLFFAGAQNAEPVLPPAQASAVGSIALVSGEQADMIRQLLAQQFAFGAMEGVEVIPPAALPPPSEDQVPGTEEDPE